MTELAICLLPLGLVMLGTVLLGHLTMGRQESAKALGWYMLNPDVTGPGSLNGRFFLNDAGTPRIADKILNAPPEPAATSEEPVLPYGNKLEGVMDLTAAIERALERIITADGFVRIRDAKGVVKKLARLGLVTNYKSAVNTSVPLDFDNPEETPLPTLAIDQDVLRMVADALGGTPDGLSGSGSAPDAFVRYARVEATSYLGGLPALGIGQARLTYEADDADAQRFRGEWTLRGPQGTPLALLEGVLQNPDALRGTHRPGQLTTVKLGAFDDTFYDEDGVRIDPTSASMRSKLWNEIHNKEADDTDWSKTEGW